MGRIGHEALSEREARSRGVCEGWGPRHEGRFAREREN